MDRSDDGGNTAHRRDPEQGELPVGEPDGFAEALALVGRQQPSAAVLGRTRNEAADRTGEPRPMAWDSARTMAVRAGRACPPRIRQVSLEQSLGHLLAAPLVALCDLPPFDTSAMDGWAVAGPGPWGIVGGGSLLAGQGATTPLEDGSAVRIATGARIPPEATAVIRTEHARTDAEHRQLSTDRSTSPGQDIRPRGQECRSGDQLLPASALVTPAVLGMAAAAGYDELSIAVRPRAEVLILGDELLTEGLPHDGLIRDALGPLVGPWLAALGVDVIGTRLIGDDADALYQAVITSEADLVLTTGGTAAGPVDHVHPVLHKAGAELLVDSVAVRPGHPMLLAAWGLRGGGGRPRYLVGLPGNPLAAVSGLLSLVQPLLRGLMGLPLTDPHRVPMREPLPGHPQDTRLIPAVLREGQLVPLRYGGPAMLRGVVAADGLAVVPPGGVRSGEVVELLDLPWALGA